jgi:hypothetical protein
MKTRRRVAIVIGIVVAALIVVAVGVTLAVNLAPKPVATLSKVSYSQTKAVPGWDDSTRTTTDPAQLKALHDVLQNDHWAPGPAEPQTGCAGGLGTNLAMTFQDGSKATLHVYECGAQREALTKDITALVSQWRKNAG